MISGALSSNSLFKRLLRLITRRYRSFKSEVAKRPPSNCTIGRISGGMTGKTSIIIHSGRLPDCLNASATSKRLRIRVFFCPVASASSSRSCALSASTSISSSRVLIASAPILALKSSSYFSRISRYSFSERICILVNSVSPGSVTIYFAKYSTFSRSRGEMSKIRPILDGMPLKYQMCETGATNSMCPMRSRRTLDFVISTPQRSQTLPL